MQQIPGIPGVPGAVPIIGRQGPSNEQRMRMELMQMVNQLSLGIYSHLATSAISNLDTHQEVDAEQLRKLAKDSHLAAKAYFEGLGIAKFEG